MTSDEHGRRTSHTRTDGMCATCNRRQNELTEISIGSGFLQLCDDCLPFVKEALEDV